MTDVCFSLIAALPDIIGLGIVIRTLTMSLTLEYSSISRFWVNIYSSNAPHQFDSALDTWSRDPNSRLARTLHDCALTAHTLRLVSI